MLLYMYDFEVTGQVVSFVTHSHIGMKGTTFESLAMVMSHAVIHGGHDFEMVVMCLHSCTW